MSGDSSGSGRSMGEASGSEMLFRSLACGFAAAFRGPPHEGAEVMYTTAGPVTISTFTFEDVDGSYYAVVLARYPTDVIRQAAPGVVLEGACNGMVMSVSGRLVSSVPMIWDGFEGRALSYEVPRAGQEHPWRGQARVILVDTRLYQAIVIAPGATGLAAERFLDSFRHVPG